MSLPTKIARTALAAGLAAAAMIGFAVAPAQAATPTYYELVGLGSTKCLDVKAEDGGGNGSRVQTWQCFGSANQRWAIHRVGTTNTGAPYFQIVSKAPGGLCMEVRNSSFSDGAQVDVVGCSQDGNQFWRWGSGNIGYSLPLISLNSGKCLDVSGNSTANGAKVQQWTCNGTTAQYFKTVQ